MVELINAEPKSCDEGEKVRALFPSGELSLLFCASVKPKLESGAPALLHEEKINNSSRVITPRKK
jgi:hypothetical protein